MEFRTSLVTLTAPQRSRAIFGCIFFVLQLVSLAFVFKQNFFLKFLFFLIYLFLSALGLRCCVRAFSSCGEQALLFVAVCGPLIAVACLVVENRL